MKIHKKRVYLKEIMGQVGWVLHLSVSGQSLEMVHLRVKPKLNVCVELDSN